LLADLRWPIFSRVTPVYISIEEAARLVGCSRSTVKRWLKESRDLIDAGQKPRFYFIDPKDGQHGRVHIHRRRRTPPVSPEPLLQADALPTRAIRHDHVLLALSGGGVMTLNRRISTLLRMVFLGCASWPSV
jgi:Homeodomain-like domain